MNDQCKPDENGNCQHAVKNGPLSWTIPLGTHIIGGRTVCVDSSLGLVDTNPQKADESTRDLLRILEEHDVTISIHPDEFKDLLSEISIFMVNRDHRVLQHGIEVGEKGLIA